MLEYLRIHLSVRLSPLPLPLSLVDLAIQISLIWLPWFAWRQRFVILSFYVSFKGQHQPKEIHF